MFKGKLNKINELINIIFLIFTTIIFLFYSIEGTASNFNKCISKANTTAGTRNCIAEENRIIDKQLNGSYAKLLKLLSLSGQKKLRYSERAWLKFRKEECKFSGHAMDGGTGEPVLINSCYLEITRGRLNHLNKEMNFYKKHPDI